MRAKEELEQLEGIEKKIKMNLALVEHYRDMAAKCIAIISDMPKGGGTGNKVGSYALLAVEAEYRLDRLQDDYYNLTQEIKQTLDAMATKDEETTENYRNVLKYKYLCGMKWQEVADKMGYSLRHTTKMHGWALVEYEKVMQKK